MTGNDLLDLLKALPTEKLGLELYRCDSGRYMPVEELKEILVDDFGVEIDQEHAERSVTRVLAI